MVTYKQKWYCHKACEYARQVSKDWDYFCISCSSYLNGYQQARQDAIDTSKHREPVPVSILEKLGTHEVDTVIEDGTHQLAARSFEIWTKQNKALTFEQALKVYMIHYKIEDIRVDVSQDGVVSFQGTARKKL